MVNIFLSWSEEAGRQIAEALREMLPVILPGSNPFISTTDIETGSQWRESLDKKLRETSYGMFILTPENTTKISEWMAYEAGAITTKDKEIHACTLLFEVQPTSMPKYLLDFQFSSFKEAEWKKLLRQIFDELQHDTTEVSTKNHKSDSFETMFRWFWNDFDDKVKSILKESKSASESTSVQEEFSKDGKAICISEQEVIGVMRSIQEFSGFVVKIPSIESKIDDLFNQFTHFQSLLASPLRETGLLTSRQSGSGSQSHHRLPSLRRLQNIVASIERDGLIDDESLKELKSALEELT